MIGFWTVEKFTGAKDGAGFYTQILAKNRMNDGVRATLYLPPYLRQAQCGIDKGSTVWGIVDDVTGIGVALFGENSADYGYFLDADLNIKKGLSVKNDVMCDADVKAGTISLKTHTHPITAAQFSGVIDPTTGAATGQITGNTEAPQ